MTRTKKSPTASIVRSSAAEYLTFVAASGAGGVEAVYADENVWLSQKMMAQLYDVDVRTINYHLKTIFSDSELQEDSVIRNFRITAADGKGYDTKHYNLSAIIAVGYKVNSERAVQFRKPVEFSFGAPIPLLDRGRTKPVLRTSKGIARRIRSPRAHVRLRAQIAGECLACATAI
jgi:hypothetical protein